MLVEIEPKLKDLLAALAKKQQEIEELDDISDQAVELERTLQAALVSIRAIRSMLELA